MATNFSENLSVLYKRSGLATQGAFAQKLGIDRSVVSKLLTGSREPTTLQRTQIARFFKLEFADLDLSNPEFLEKIDNVLPKSDLIFLSFRTIKQNFERREEIAARYAGDYVIYYPQNDEGVIASLLSIGRATREGIEVSFINPHRDSEGRLSAYEYSGYMYSVREFLYFYLEQKSDEWEITTLIVHEARTPQVNVLKGMISGIGVHNDISYIAARPIVLHRRQRKVDNWRPLMGSELGYLPAGRVPNIARTQLSDERITVKT